MRRCKAPHCISYALNEHPDSGLCDLCYQKEIIAEAKGLIEILLELPLEKTTIKQITAYLKKTLKVLNE